MTRLQYKTPSTPTQLPPAWRSSWFRIAVLCWLVPLVAGLVIFFWFQAIRPPGYSIFQKVHPVPPIPAAVGHQLVVLGDCGLVTLLVGTTLAVYGCISLIVFAMLRWGSAVDRWRQVVRPALAGVGLLLSNFAVAAVLISILSR
jgi:hypothetical protein